MLSVFLLNIQKVFNISRNISSQTEIGLLAFWRSGGLHLSWMVAWCWEPVNNNNNEQNP